MPDPPTAGPAAGTRSRAPSESSVSSASEEPLDNESFACAVCGPTDRWSSTKKFIGHVNRNHRWRLFSPRQLILWNLVQCPKCAKLTKPGKKGEVLKHNCEPSILARHVGDILNRDGTTWTPQAPEQTTPTPSPRHSSSRPPASSPRTPSAGTPSDASPTPRPFAIKPIQHRRPSQQFPPPTVRSRPSQTGQGSRPSSSLTPTTQRHREQIASMPVFGPSPSSSLQRERTASLPSTPSGSRIGPSLARTQSLGSTPRRPSQAPASTAAEPPASRRPKGKGKVGRPKRPPRPTAPPGGCGSDLPVQDLALYPTCRRISAARTQSSWRACISRLARKFNDQPNEDNCRALLLAPKLALQAAAHRGTAATHAALASYPHIPTPPPPPAPSGTTNPVTRATRLMAQGRPGAAGRALADQTPLAEPGPATDAELDRLHPQSQVDPFAEVPPTAFNRPVFTVNDETLTAVAHSFDRATAAGPDGWNMPLLELVIDDPDFRKALRSLLSLILAGTAPCRDILCASTLIPLKKGDDGVRPVAMGTLFYRMATKAILRQKSLSPALLDCQFGVGVPGGVEPLLFRLEDTLATIPPDPANPVYVTCLDFKNAFNSLSRTAIVQAVRKHAPHLLPLLRWSYGTPAPLISKSADGRPTLRWSSEGVRQGCPLGPGLFSLALRDFLQDLLDHLRDDSPTTNMGCFLDDMSVVGTDPQVIDKVDLFLASRGNLLTLNKAKSKTVLLSEVRDRGLHVLGTVLGPLHARREFLSQKILDCKLKFNQLLSLSRQNAFLILRFCYQLDLSHLLRSLNPDGLEDLWQQHDDNLFSIYQAIRGPSEEPFYPSVDEDEDRCLFSFPAKFGGMGIFSHTERSPVARAAALSSAQSTLSKFIPSIQPPSDHRSQRERHQALLHDRARDFLRQLTPNKQARVLESQSQLGRTWLACFPTVDTFEIPDHIFTMSLFYRSLASVSVAICPLCSKCRDTGDLQWGHEDNCPTLQPGRSARHDDIEDTLVSAFSAIHSVRATVEPSIPNHDVVYNDVRADAAPGHPLWSRRRRHHRPQPHPGPEHPHHQPHTWRPPVLRPPLGL